MSARRSMAGSRKPAGLRTQGTSGCGDAQPIVVGQNDNMPERWSLACTRPALPNVVNRVAIPVPPSVLRSSNVFNKNNRTTLVKVTLSDTPFYKRLTFCSQQKSTHQMTGLASNVTLERHTCGNKKRLYLLVGSGFYLPFLLAAIPTTPAKLSLSNLQQHHVLIILYLMLAIRRTVWCPTYCNV